LTCLLTPAHWGLLDDAARRLKLSRSDVVALLLYRYASRVTIPSRFPTE